MYHMSFPRFPSFIRNIQLQKAADFFGEVKGPEIILAGQQTVEHDIGHRGICVPGIMQIVHGEASQQRSVLHDIIFYVCVDGAGIGSFAAVLNIIFLRVIRIADTDAEICFSCITQLRRNGIFGDTVIAVVETLVVGVQVIGSVLKRGIQQERAADIPARTQGPFL